MKPIKLHFLQSLLNSQQGFKKEKTLSVNLKYRRFRITVQYTMLMEGAEVFVFDTFPDSEGMNHSMMFYNKCLSSCSVIIGISFFFLSLISSV